MVQKPVPFSAIAKLNIVGPGIPALMHCIYVEARHRGELFRRSFLPAKFSLSCYSVYITPPLTVLLTFLLSPVIYCVHKMAYPYNKQSISILVGTSATAFTSALLVVLRWRRRRHVNESLFGRLHWILQLLQLLCGVMSCILAVVSRHRPAVDHSVILSTAGLVTILSNQLGEVSPYSLCVA